MERDFQFAYFERIRPLLRPITFLLALMFAAYAIRDYLDTRSLALAARQDGAPALFFALFCGLTWNLHFARVWQPLALAGGLLVAAISLFKMAAFIASMHLAPAAAATAFPADSLFFGQQMRLLMVCMALLRFQFRWAIALQLGIVLIGSAAFLTRLLTDVPTANDISRFLQPLGAIFVAVLLAALVEEQLARQAFAAHHELALQRDEEHRLREQIEKNLHILSNSIGGIVHDLGNPLTTVQMGAQTLDLCLQHEAADLETLQEITGAIGDGAQMLNFLRLSLIEQTRVLEGEPTPVELKATRIAPIVEMGAKFQKPIVTARRDISFEGEDGLVCADKMKLATVFMNLIGNALKYSDGRVRVKWRRLEAENLLLVAVCDEGTAQCGLTRISALQLFTAFGRLETHRAVEGTGLGLPSIRNIVAAHGGQSYIEGFESGTPDSARFSTAARAYPSLLSDDFRTAFVVTCPLVS